MFKVLRKNSLSDLQRHRTGVQIIDLELLAKYCQIEDWSASANSGLFMLGDIATYKHNIQSSSCGMLTLINSYIIEDRNHIAEIFDMVCATNSTFSYSSTIVGSDGFEQPVMVIGESIIDDVSEPILKGVFVFPHFQKDPVQKFQQ